MGQVFFFILQKRENQPVDKKPRLNKHTCVGDVMYSVTDSTLELVRLFVRDGYRGQRHGKAEMLYALKLAFDNPEIQYVVLDDERNTFDGQQKTNATGKVVKNQMYEKLGFEVIEGKTMSLNKDADKVYLRNAEEYFGKKNVNQFKVTEWIGLDE